MAQVIWGEGAPILRSDWHVEDILSQDPDLTDDQVLKVMHLIANHHDACVGINWDVIDCAIQQVKEESCSAYTV